MIYVTEGPLLTLFDLVIVSVICLVLRAFPRVGKPFVGHDTWAILLVVDELKKGNGYNGVSRYFLLGGEHDYPPLFFYFLALFPSGLLRKYNWLVNPLLDSVNAAILFLLTFFLTSNLLVSVTAGVMYSFTPVVLGESLTLSTRIFGMMLFNITLLAFLLYQVSTHYVFVLLMIATGTLVLLSHKFSTEVLWLLLLSFTVIDRSYLPLLVLLATVAGAILFSGGFYLKVLRGHLGILTFWLRHHSQYGADYVKKEGLAARPQPRRSQDTETSSSTLSLRRLWVKTRRANPLYWLLHLNPFNPFSLVVLLLPFLGIENDWERTLFQWSVLTLILYYAATYIRRLGRYPGRTQFLDYNAFPTALLCSIFLWVPFSWWSMFIVMVAFVLSIIQNRRASVAIRAPAEDQSLLESIFDYLKSSPKDGVICLPSSHTYAIPYFTGKKVFYTMSAANYEKLAAFFPVLTVPIETLSRQYGINFVLVDKKLVLVDEIDLSSFKAVIGQNDYLLLEKSPRHVRPNSSRIHL
jgi:hypothetical protein